MREFYSAPFYIDISLTNRCNLKCRYCYADADNQKFDFLSVELLQNLMKEFEKLEVHYVRLAGGEPLLHPEFEKIIDIVGKSKLLTSISTNATIVTKNLAKAIKEAGIDWVVVSLDGANEKSNNKTRGKFKEAEIGIKNLIEAGNVVKIASVVTNYNYREYKDLIAYAEKLKVDSIGFILFSAVGRGYNNNKLKMDEIKLGEFIRGINQYKEQEKYQKFLNIVFPHESKVPWELKAFLSDEDIQKRWKKTMSEQKRDISCMAGISTTAISARGELYGCEQMMGFEELKAGVLNGNNFSLLWNESEVFNKLRKLQISVMDSKCQKCKFQGCGGGCRAMAYAESGNLYGMDSSCEIVMKNLL